MKKQNIYWKKGAARAISLALSLFLLIGLAPAAQFSTAVAEDAVVLDHITLVPNLPSSLFLGLDNIIEYRPTEYPIQTAVHLYSSTGNEITSSSYSVVYISDNPGVTPVDSSGLIAHGPDYGIATVTAIVTLDGVTKTASLKLNASKKPSKAKYVYDFTNIDTASWPGTDLRNIKFENTNNTYEYYGVGSDVAGTFSWAKTATDVCLVTDGGDTATTRVKLNLSYSTSDHKWALFKIHVPTAGRYSAKLNVYNNGTETTTLKLRAYIVEARDISTINSLLSTASGCRFGSSVFGDYTCTADVGFVEVSLADQVTIPEAGDYLFAIKRASSNSKMAEFNKLTLDGTADGGVAEVISSAALSLSDNALEVGETATAQVTGATMSDSTAADISTAVKTFGSSNPAVATVDATGLVTAVKGGTADIYASVKLSSATGIETVVSEKKTVTVTKNLTGIAVTTPPTKTEYSTGDTLDTAGMVVTASYNDTTTAPVTGYSCNPTTLSTEGTQTVTVSYTEGGIAKTATFDVTVAAPNQDQDAPTGLVGVAPTSAANNDGKITGTTTAMEYKLLADSTYTTVTDTQITGLAAGTYDVRYAAKTGYNAGADAVVVVPAYQAPTLSSIAVTTPPTKTTYIVGDTLDTTGMAVTASYSDSTNATVTGYTCNPTTLTTEGTQTITVSYTEGEVTKTTTFDVTVNPAEEQLPSTGCIHATATDTASGSAIDGNVVTSDAPGFVMNSPNNISLGEQITLQAAHVDGKTFRYWKNVPSGRIVSTSESYTFKVGSNTYLTAVYSVPQSGQYLVEFVDKNGKVLQSSYLNQNAAIVKPADPFAVGYTFTGWSPMVPATATQNGTFSAQYSVETPSYTLAVAGPATVEGGNGSPYAFNQKVTLNVDSASVPANEKFAYWQRDGKIISYDTSYSFYVWGNTSVEAVCVPDATAVNAVPQIMMDSAKVIGSRVVFSSERTIPAGYELVETGILLKQGSGAKNSLKIVGGSYDYKAVAQSTNANGQFSIRKDNASGAWYACAYVIYKDGSDNLKVIYSNIVNGTVQ